MDKKHIIDTEENKAFFTHLAIECGKYVRYNIYV